MRIFNPLPVPMTGLVIAGAILAAPTIAEADIRHEAVFETPPSSPRFIERDSLWQCEGATCRSTAGPSRPLIVCSTLARKIGRLLAFRSNDASLDARQMEQCNKANHP